MRSIVGLISSYWLRQLNLKTADSKKEISIAVLPLRNMSASKDLDYFGEGMAEEILNTLVNYDEIKVAGRTSSFSFIKAKIAPEKLSSINKKKEQNSEAYLLFLKAKHIHLNRYYGNYNIDDFNLSEKLFFETIHLDSSYALAYAGLADLYDSHKDALSDDAQIKHYDSLKIKFSERAWELNPNLSYVNIVRGWVMRNKKVEPSDLDEAYDNFLRGYQLNPSITDGLFGLAFLHEDKSLMEDADKLLDKAIELDPLRPANYSVKGDFLTRAGKYDLAIQANRSALHINPRDLYALSQIALNQAFLKNWEKSLETYHKIQQIDSNYLDKSVLDKKMFAFLKGDLETARTIPTSSLDYRGENVIINSLIGNVDSLETSFLKWWDWWKKFKGEKVFSQSSAYIELLNNPIYAQLRPKPWYQKILRKEKEKYDLFYATYPRAEKLLKLHRAEKVVVKSNNFIPLLFD